MDRSQGSHDIQGEQGHHGHAGDAQIESDHAVLQKGNVEEGGGDDERCRPAGNPEVVGVVLSLHQKPGVDVAGEDGRQRGADGVVGGNPSRQHPRHHQPHQSGGQVLLHQERVDLVRCRELRHDRSPENSKGDVEPHHSHGHHAGGQSGGLEVPLRTGRQQTHGLGVVHQAISYQDDDPAEDDQGGRHPRLVPADVQHGVGQLGIDLLESALQARPPPDRAPQNPPQDDRCHQHHDGLQRVGSGDRSESAGGRVEGGRHGDGSHQPPGGAPPMGQDRESEVEREGDIAQDVSAVLELNEGAQQAGARTEAVFQVLGIGEHAAAVKRQEYEVGRYHPADGQPQPPGGQVGEPEGVGPADHGHVIPAVHGGGEHR